MPDFILRPALEADAPLIRDLIHRVGINPMDLDWTHFMIAESTGGQFMGCGQLKPHRDGSLEMASLAVEKEYRHQGVARSLIAYFLAHSPRPLFLMCQPSLVTFYEIFGFKEIRTEEMPPYFRFISKLVHWLIFLSKHAAPVVMRLD